MGGGGGGDWVELICSPSPLMLKDQRGHRQNNNAKGVGTPLTAAVYLLFLVLHHTQCLKVYGFSPYKYHSD